MTLARPFAALRASLRAVAASWLYGWVFRLLIALVPQVEELEAMLDMLEGGRDERLL